MILLRQQNGANSPRALQTNRQTQGWFRVDNSAYGSVNAVELTVEQAWYIAEMIGAGSFPWVLAITTPYTSEEEKHQFHHQQREELIQLGIIVEETIHPQVAQWIRIVCFPDRWFDLRYVNLAEPTSDHEPSLLRGIIARQDYSAQGPCTVVALRMAHLVTFTLMHPSDYRGLVPIVTVGLRRYPPAQFATFHLPARVGARADEQLRRGVDLSEVLDYLGISPQACQIVESVFAHSRSYVEIVAGCSSHGQHSTTTVGVSVIDAAPGRILVCPSQAFDHEWISTFQPGTDGAIAMAVEQLTTTLPCGSWFPDRQSSQESRSRSF